MATGSTGSQQRAQLQARFDAEVDTNPRKSTEEESSKAWNDLDRLETTVSFPGLEVEDLPGVSQFATLDELPDEDLSDVCLQFNSQAWVETRFRDMEPGDFVDNMRWYAPSHLKPPEGFAGQWFTYDSADDADKLAVSDEEAETMRAFVVLVNPYEESELELLRQYLVSAEPVENAPPVIWALHSNEMVASSKGNGPLSADDLLELHKKGLDGVISNEDVGFTFAMQVQALVKSIEQRMSKINEALNEKHQRPWQYQETKANIEHILWTYLISRAAPEMKNNYTSIDSEGPENERVVGGKKLGDVLRKGSYGALIRACGERKASGSCETIKEFSKSKFPDINDVLVLSRTLDIHSLLRQEQWRHPNLLRCTAAYGSDANFFLHFESGGSYTLVTRLDERIGRPSKPFPVNAIQSVMAQMAAAVAHIHSGPQVAHRDIKPESFVYSEDEDGMPLVKLTDFELASRQRLGEKCSSVCGTQPFTAPEVYLHKKYDGMAADVWSLGITLLELQCGTRTLGKMLQLPSPGEAANKSIATKLLATLGKTEWLTRYLEDYGHLGLSGILPQTEQVVLEMLRVKPEDRWQSTVVSDFLKAATLKRKSAIVAVPQPPSEPASGPPPGFRRPPRLA